MKKVKIKDLSSIAIVSEDDLIVLDGKTTTFVDFNKSLKNKGYYEYSFRTTNADSMLEPGEYLMGTSTPNIPIRGVGTLFVKKIGTSRYLQFFLSDMNQFFTRAKNGDYAWSPWKEL